MSPPTTSRAGLSDDSDGPLWFGWPDHEPGYVLAFSYAGLPEFELPVQPHDGRRNGETACRRDGKGTHRLTVAELAADLGYSVHQTYRLLERGLVPGAFKAGSRWYIPGDAPARFRAQAAGCEA